MSCVLFAFFQPKFDQKFGMIIIYRNKVLSLLSKYRYVFDNKYKSTSVFQALFFLSHFFTIQEFSFLEGGSLYLVNCTTERELCTAHKIRGYPYITAFRGQGWLGHSHCVSQNSEHLPYTRTNYHGVIQVMLELSQINICLTQCQLTDPAEC